MFWALPPSKVNARIWAMRQSNRAERNLEAERAFRPDRALEPAQIPRRAMCVGVAEVLQRIFQKLLTTVGAWNIVRPFSMMILMCLLIQSSLLLNQVKPAR